MSLISRMLVVMTTMGIAAPAIACSPLPLSMYAKTEQRVRERFDSVVSVVLVTLVSVRIVKFKELAIDLEGEEETFRVKRVFKGRSKVGDKLVLFSSSTCARRVTEWANERGSIKLPRTWLIYRNEAARTEITDSDMTQPVQFVAFDLKILPKLAKQHAKPASH